MGILDIDSGVLNLVCKSVPSAQGDNVLSTVALSASGLTGHMLWFFSTKCDSFLYGIPIDRKLDQLRNQSVSYAEVALRRYDSLGQNMCKAINPQNARLIILPSVIALKYAFIMEML